LQGKELARLHRIAPEFQRENRKLPTIPCWKKLRRFGVLENTAALDTCGTNKRK
jgi:hypothetical protein